MSQLTSRRSKRIKDTAEVAKTPATTSGAVGEGGVQQRSAPAPTPVRARRRPAMTALGVALVAVGGIVGALVLSSGGHARDVVMLRSSVVAGHQITTGDLTTTQLTGAVGVGLITQDQISTLVGKYPRQDLPKGTLLTAQMTTNSLDPEAGSSIVGIPVKSGQIPGQGLHAGEKVRIVLQATTGANASGTLPDGLEIGQTWPATISSVTTTSSTGGAGTASTSVDVTISSGTAPQISTAAGTGQLAIVLDPSGTN